MDQAEAYYNISGKLLQMQNLAEECKALASQSGLTLDLSPLAYTLSEPEGWYASDYDYSYSWYDSGCVIWD